HSQYALTLTEKPLNLISLEKLFTLCNKYNLENVITHLFLNDCSITEIPPTIQTFRSLKVLNLKGNNLKSLPREVLTLKSLKELCLDNNEIQDLPDDIKELTALQKFSAKNNLLVTLPKTFGKLENLKVLSICGNKLESIEILERDLPQLFSLSASKNPLMKTFPIIRSTSLRLLELTDNSIEGIEEQALDGLTELVTLNVANNHIEKVPSSICKLGKLVTINLSNCYISSLPEEIGELKHLRNLFINNNRLRDLPVSIRGLEQLTELCVSENMIQRLPATIGELNKLKYLSVNQNKLGEIPESIATLEHLEILEAHTNWIDRLPNTSFTRMKRLRVFDLRCNLLSTVPNEIYALPRTATVNLEGNQFSAARVGQIIRRVQERSYEGPDFSVDILDLKDTSTVSRNDLAIIVSEWKKGYSISTTTNYDAEDTYRSPDPEEIDESFDMNGLLCSFLLNSDEDGSFLSPSDSKALEKLEEYTKRLRKIAEYRASTECGAAAGSGAAAAAAAAAAPSVEAIPGPTFKDAECEEDTHPFWATYCKGSMVHETATLYDNLAIFLSRLKNETSRDIEESEESDDILIARLNPKLNSIVLEILREIEDEYTRNLVSKDIQAAAASQRPSPAPRKGSAPAAAAAAAAAVAVSQRPSPEPGKGSAPEDSASVQTPETGQVESPETAAACADDSPFLSACLSIATTGVGTCIDKVKVAYLSLQLLLRLHSKTSTSIDKESAQIHLKMVDDIINFIEGLEYYKYVYDPEQFLFVTIEDCVKHYNEKNPKNPLSIELTDDDSSYNYGKTEPQLRELAINAINEKRDVENKLEKIHIMDQVEDMLRLMYDERLIKDETLDKIAMTYGEYATLTIDPTKYNAAVRFLGLRTGGAAAPPK
ncbi:hypothetical protein DID78_07070, partial [Candidatus Marinamargulisbacteria bacterium SCGC AG-343-D04]